MTLPKEPPVQIDSERVQSMLDQLHAIGQRPTGGVFRGVYSKPWREARDLIAEWMRAAGLTVTIDAVGNVRGRLSGRIEGTPIVAGSHFDTVPDGGKYDGQLGVIGAINAVDALRRQFGQPQRTIEVLAACEEEGSRFHCNFWASRGLLGLIGADEPDKLVDFEGTTMAAAMRDAGLDPARVADAKTQPFGAFLELHIEQGPVLERLQNELEPDAKRIVGAVTAITGTGRFHVTLTGQPDHSGTMPMIGRRDALLGMAEIALAMRELALGVGHPAVMTVGHVDIVPNIPNVVPGVVKFTIDARHPDGAVLSRMMAAARLCCIAAAETRNLDVEVDEIWVQPPVQMAPEIVERVRQAIAANGFQPVDIIAGAGHDAQIIGRSFPTAMIFVISKGGRSHCPDEFTTAEDCAAGVQVLADTMHGLAY